MNKPIFRYITILAILAAVVLQGVWFMNSYRLLEKELYSKVNDAFDQGQIVGHDIMSRRNKKAIPDGTYLEIDSTRIRNSKNISVEKYYVIAALHHVHNKFGIALSKALLDSCFREELARLNLGKLYFRVDTVAIDTVSYKYIEDLMTDSARVTSYSQMTTHIHPITYDFSKGLQATIENPYRTILMQMGMFLVGTALLLFIVIYCLVQQIKVIIRQNKITRLREDFSNAMIHDMKTPLASIIMSTRMLKSGKANDKPEITQKFFQVIEDESDHLLTLVDKALTLSKAEAGKLHLQKQEILLRPMIDDLTEKFTLKSEKPVEFNIQLEVDKVYADAGYLKEAISNLIDNGVKYSGDSVRIEMDSYLNEKGETCISVKDNGLGIPLKDHKKIFEKFERASAMGRSRKGGATGFGLGLNYVLNIVRAHGGNVQVDSIEGEYSEFTIVLPPFTM